ncbi:helix-turn-helix transcriptional regulator [Kitasatospora aureofaciens]|uniref:helix-turn-helix domain-containing protein n=1 Tax=Kitasatospora aureofaciens TaxID=1894 RepID=UPI001C47D560|nr:helix-turn-helix transcriptional regulator [Kitasatospora aureofaciens]MBV6695821.1 helix-turn-helix domain-containing protein [Kitasatospora aureofaciens]
MPPSKIPPSIRQRRLGAELRRLREQAGLSVTRAGELHGTQQSRISNIESGGYPVSADRVRALARLYGCADDALIDALTRMTGGRTRGWWEEYREILPAGALDLAVLEHHAQSMRIASAIHIPGLLQTPEHARALFRDVVPPFSPPEVEHLVSHRIKRQAVIYGEQPIPLSAVVHEAALRMGFGGPKVARGQLEYLLTASERPHIDLRVIPFGTGSYPSSGAGIVYFNAEVARLDSVQVDGDRSEFIDTEPQLIKYRAVMDRLEVSALQPDASRDLIRRIAQRI